MAHYRDMRGDEGSPRSRHRKHRGLFVLKSPREWLEPGWYAVQDRDDVMALIELADDLADLSLAPACYRPTGYYPDENAGQGAYREYLN